MLRTRGAADEIGTRALELLREDVSDLIEFLI